MIGIARRSRRLCFFAALVAGLALSVATSTALGAYSGFVATYCKQPIGYPMSSITRQGSIDFAYIAVHEGYQWGGGCWNNNNRDDSQGDPPQNASTGGEGPDCSGFVFKTWREPLSQSSRSAWEWRRLINIHGPYGSGSFKDGVGEVNVTYPKSGLIRMDALASYYHIGMVYSRNGDGTDVIVEARGEAYGTGIWVEAYRSNSAYTGVRRLYWNG